MNKEGYLVQNKAKDTVGALRKAVGDYLVLREIIDVAMTVELFQEHMLNRFKVRGSHG